MDSTTTPECRNQDCRINDAQSLLYGRGGLCVHCTRKENAARYAAVIALPGPFAREFSPCGPCICRGKVVKSTAKFHVCRSPHTGEDTRISQTRLHTEDCSHCPGSEYARNWND